MMAVAKKTKKPATTPWYDGTVDVESLAPHQQLAHRLVTQYRDLTPSVDRIMNAEVSDDARMSALSAFADSIGQTGDPNRDPRVALANAVAAESK
jgi:hypothetical protein